MFNGLRDYVRIVYFIFFWVISDIFYYFYNIVSVCIFLDGLVINVMIIIIHTLWGCVYNIIINTIVGGVLMII